MGVRLSEMCRILRNFFYTHDLVMMSFPLLNWNCKPSNYISACHVFLLVTNYDSIGGIQNSVVETLKHSLFVIFGCFTSLGFPFTNFFMTTNSKLVPTFVTQLHHSSEKVHWALEKTTNLHQHD